MVRGRRPVRSCCSWSCDHPPDLDAFTSAREGLPRPDGDNDDDDDEVEAEVAEVDVDDHERRKGGDGPMEGLYMDRR